MVYRKAFKGYAAHLEVAALVVGKVFLWSCLLILPGIFFLTLYGFAGIGTVLDGQIGGGLDYLWKWAKRWGRSVLQGGLGPGGLNVELTAS